jgi:hypothetical protein
MFIMFPMKFVVWGYIPHFQVYISNLYVYIVYIHTDWLVW